jgi:hypothetical protein
MVPPLRLYVLSIVPRGKFFKKPQTLLKGKEFGLSGRGPLVKEKSGLTLEKGAVPAADRMKKQELP